ncbi:hypothetical protein [Nostoc sp.]|uniref:hypothetical protein n=1 Tax=Nostoc sp. TaxID=1180 RepID=UPI002FF6AC08
MVLAVDGTVFDVPDFEANARIFRNLGCRLGKQTHDPQSAPSTGKLKLEYIYIMQLKYRLAYLSWIAQ